MNKPFTHPPTYEQDVYGWSQHQAELLRAGRLAEIDRANIAEEIESVGAAEYRHLASALRVLLSHMLKWDHQMERRSRSWALTILEQRDRLDGALDQNPSLKHKLDEALIRAYRQARVAAARETELPLATFPATTPYTWQDITTRAYLTGDE